MKKISCIIITLLFLIGCDRLRTKVYLVKETNCIHSSNDKADCIYIEQAENEGYQIVKIDYKDAPYKEYDICMYCFPTSKVDSYNDKLADIKEIRRNIQMNKARRDSMLLIRDSLVNSVSEEVREAIIDDYLENVEYGEEGFYDDEYRSPYFGD